MQILQSGNKYQTGNLTGTHKQLPIGVYLLKINPNTGEYYLEKKSNNFKLPSKIYGDNSVIKRYLKSYYSNIDKNLGVILSGLKGTGKTITAQILCNEINLPIILINQPYHGNEFISFMSNSLFHECVIFVDEFEKIYLNQNSDNGTAAMSDFLSLMDGNFKSHKLFLLTVNDFKINDFLVNRPSRIRYRKHYEQLDDSIVNEVIDDLLKYPKHKQSIIDFLIKLDFTTFDILVEIIKEVNLFNENALVAAKHLNLKLELHTYEVSEIIPGHNKPKECSTISFSPMLPKLNYHRYWFDKIVRTNNLDEDSPNDDKSKLSIEERFYEDNEYVVELKTKDLVLTKIPNGYSFILPDTDITVILQRLVPRNVLF